MADDAVLLGRKAALFPAGEITAVMHDTDIVGINVVRCPVQACQLTEICVALRDIFARIIADITAGRVDGMAHLHRQIHILYLLLRWYQSFAEHHRLNIKLLLRSVL